MEHNSWNQSLRETSDGLEATLRVFLATIGTVPLIKPPWFEHLTTVLLVQVFLVSVTLPGT